MLTSTAHDMARAVSLLSAFTAALAMLWLVDVVSCAVLSSVLLPCRLSLPHCLTPAVSRPQLPNMMSCLDVLS